MGNGEIRYTGTPFRAALKALCGKSPPRYVKYRWEDDSADDLHVWVLKNAPLWMTGYGVIEAATSIVLTSIENGNLKEHEWPPGVVDEQIKALFRS